MNGHPKTSLQCKRNRMRKLISYKNNSQVEGQISKRERVWKSEIMRGRALTVHFRRRWRRMVAPFRRIYWYDMDRNFAKLCFHFCVMVLFVCLFCLLMHDKLTPCYLTRLSNKQAKSHTKIYKKFNLRTFFKNETIFA